MDYSVYTFFEVIKRLFIWENTRFQSTKPLESNVQKEISAVRVTPLSDEAIKDVCPAPRSMPMILPKDPVVLSFEDVPGPRSLKYLANFRQYISDIGTQITAGFLTIGLNAGAYFHKKKPNQSLSTLFDEYGPVVRFVSPVGGDVVLINRPDHIQKVYNMEGVHPVRSALDSLEKYRSEYRSHVYGGIYAIHGPEWTRRRSVMDIPLQDAITQHVQGICESCDMFTQKIYNLRNYQDEIPKDLVDELNKWAFDCMGLIIFSKKFEMLDKELIYSQCDMSWLYHSLVKASEAIAKCESGLHLWKLMPTPAWYSLVKYCDSLDNLIGKHVLEVEQHIALSNDKGKLKDGNRFIGSMLLGEDKMNVEDIATVVMDMLLIGVNTITSAMSFLLYFIAKHQRVQRLLYQEIEENITPELLSEDINKIKERTPYVQATIKETLRLTPPIPLLTRILPKNIVLDSYNIPRGTLIMMSIQDAALKENNYDDAAKFYPERWLNKESENNHDFGSISFGYGARKCLGQNIAEVMATLLITKVLKKYKLEYHYGDIEPTRSFIAKPNKPLKIRFIDRG
ncbi:probable cytochrome P450 301a1, mitochondrial [Papilio machaon]|uniref:probable cytochrome P450 301a1, mitochondrial n=1 Tax=Papilio machaon TaxID=76193 RepID=UPI001E664256|nr:probable cytochrome P450 301a1, mitochondrial [Papilio machaon]